MDVEASRDLGLNLHIARPGKTRGPYVWRRFAALCGCEEVKMRTAPRSGGAVLALKRGLFLSCGGGRAGVFLLLVALFLD